jgi:transcriptional regulator
VYTPKAFELDEPQARLLVAEIGVASLVALVPPTESRHELPPLQQHFEATVVPLLLDGDRLLGHVARPNPIWRCSGPALAIFTGVSSYVSPSWYPSKLDDGKAVPTWNYTTVIVHGTLRHHDEIAWKRDVVERLTASNESVLHTADATHERWSIDDAPGSYIATMLNGIVGVEIEISHIVGKAKLSQNKSIDDARAVIDATPDRAMAAEMDRANSKRAIG